MTAAIVTLSLLASALGIAAAAAWARVSGLKDELHRAALLAAEEHRRAEDNALLATQAAEELRQAKERGARLVERRDAELSRLHEMAVKCMNPADLVAELNALMQPEGP